MVNRPKIFTVQEIAERVGGGVLGNAAASISGVADLRIATQHQLGFYHDPKYLKAALKTSAGAILVAPHISQSFPCTQIQVENPARAFAQVAELFTPPSCEWQPGVHATTVVAASAQIGAHVYLGPHVVVEEDASVGDGCYIGAGSYIGSQAKIGANSFLYPHVVVGERSLLGQRVIIHSGSVLGSDGFGYEFVKGAHQKIPQRGYVQIDDDVEIGANVTIDRARYDRTWIGEGTKIDNLVMIAHNVVIGKHCLIVAQSGVAGSTHLGTYVTLAAQSGVAGHTHIGDRVTITAMSGVTKDYGPGGVYSGRHARPLREAMHIEASTHRLPQLFRRVSELEKVLMQKRFGCD